MKKKISKKDNLTMAIIEISTANFNESINTNMYVIVDFYADWCGPCRMLSPFLEKASTNFNNVRFFKLNIDREAYLAQELGIMSIPCIHFYKNGELHDKFIGFKTYNEIINFISKNIE